MPAAPDPESRVSLLRRLGAALYDALICLSLILGAGILFTLLMGGTTENLRGPGPAGRALLFTLWVLLPLGYFLISWTRGGQTIGMRAWRIRLVTEAGEPVPPDRALLRFLIALPAWLAVGLGVLWSLVDPQRRTWHGRLSGTRLQRLPKDTQRAR
ncbi:MAG: RDD family protein [Thiohalorhabdus sp.]|uniref:RDD family protein n=1 Tax=Thiohalorhabdus sp. TaxID=3094134 RepID=UPI00397F8FAD